VPAINFSMMRAMRQLDCGEISALEAIDALPGDAA
jgi:hypothetical protein